MDLTGEGVVPAGLEAVFAYVADLATYPRWLGIVQTADPEPDRDPAWRVDLGARLGPLRKTKRVRMVRVACRPSSHVRFERVEQDGRDHSAWVLTADLLPEGSGTRLCMHLHYGGGRWLPGLDLLLREEVRRATGRLSLLVQD
ncbi:MAG: hypothetical protein QOI20_2828 [Acidimicrobiaceae bacterium]|nr:hypothetical protein [Acidimicrobiaceae bacterium]